MNHQQIRAEAIRVPHDYHIHLSTDESALDLHKGGALLAYAEQADRRRVQEIGISEHGYRFREFRPLMAHLIDEPGYPAVQQWLAGEFQWGLDEYVTYVQSQATQVDLPVRLGLEVDFFPEPAAQQRLAEILAPYPWDYLLGSVHFLGNWSIDMDPNLGWPTSGAGVDQVWREYWRVWGQAAASGLFSSLAHPDLPKKFGHRWSAQAHADCLQALEQALQKAKATQTAIEVNSAGLRKPVAELYPSSWFLRRARQLGVGITLGSDAHQAQDVGRDLDRAAAAAQQAGYTVVWSYRQRRARAQPLGPIEG